MFNTPWKRFFTCLAAMLFFAIIIGLIVAISPASAIEGYIGGIMVAIFLCGIWSAYGPPLPRLQQSEKGG